MPDSRVDTIIDRLRKLPQYVITIQDREGYTYERGCEGQPMNYTGILLEDAERFVEEETGFPDFVDRMIEKRDAEAAVRAAADTRTREIVDALTEQARAIPLGDRSEDSYNTAIRMVREVARRFPVSDCEGDTDET